jgi:hypothetical protein
MGYRDYKAFFLFRPYPSTALPVCAVSSMLCTDSKTVRDKWKQQQPSRWESGVVKRVFILFI